MFAYSFPSLDRSCLLDQHQAGIDEYEHMAWYVETIPEMASLQTVWFWFETSHVASSIYILDEIERFGPQEPESGRD